MNKVKNSKNDEKGKDILWTEAMYWLLVILE